MSLPIIKIDEICVTPTFHEQGLLATCSAVIGGLVQINEIKLFKGHVGLFLRYPSRMSVEGRSIEVAAPAHRIQRLKIRQSILRAYKRALQRAAEEEIQLSLFPKAA
jgi:DNA-binding cell septation regulator SpoVG